MHELPEILEKQLVAQSNLFRVEQLHLRFSNGNERVYERLVTSHERNPVMMVAMTETNEVLLVREYNAGTEQYQLSLPKGARDPGETSEMAVRRELQEEVGFDASRIRLIKTMSLAPGYMQYKIDAFLCESLCPASLEGDEPEPLEVVAWPIDQLDELFALDEFDEGRAIAAILLALPMIDGDRS
jgi:ADP-ribose diphosphatase